MPAALESTHWSGIHWRSIALLMVATVVVRAGVVIARWDQLSRDPDAYRLIAENLAARGVFSRSPADQTPVPTAFRPPLYPVALAFTSWHGQVLSAGVAALHVLIGSLTVLLTLFVARRWGLGRWSWLAAALVACDPILLNQSAEVMTETMATMLAIGCLWLLTRYSPTASWKSAMVCGVGLGLASLCRPVFLVWTALVVADVGVRGCRTYQGAGRTAVLAAGVVAALLPWVVRNQRVLNRPIVATTHGGYTLLLGNNPPFYAFLRQQRWGGVWDAAELQAWLATQAEQSERTSGAEPVEIARDRRLYALARKTIRQQPRMFMVACFVRLGRLWQPWPHRVETQESSGRRLMRWSVGAWYCALYVLATVGLIARRRTLMQIPWLWGLFLAFALSAVHTVYWSNMRMRAPLIPVISLAAAAGVAGLAARRRS